MRMPALLTLALGAVVLASAGCGGKQQSATEKWADDVCSAVSTLKQSVSQEIDGLQQAGITRQNVAEATSGIEKAANDFVDELQSLGAPQTEAVRQGREILDQLSADVSSQRDAIDRAANDTSTTLPEKITIVSGAIATIATEVGTASSKLQMLDPGGELQDAFQSSDSCADLRAAGS